MKINNLLNKIARNQGRKIRQNSMEKNFGFLQSLGFIGKCLFSCIKFIFGLLTIIPFKLTGLVYNKEKHPSWVGSCLYTMFCITMIGMMGAILVSW